MGSNPIGPVKHFLDKKQVWKYMEYFLIIAILLMILGIVGSVIPGLPGVLASMAGVLLYWWSTGYSEPGTVFLVLSIFLGTTAVVLDWVAGAITARAGGASNKTSVAAGIAGFLGFFLLGGPIGVVIASGLTVFAREYMKTGDIQKSRKAGLYSALGIAASVAFQAFVATIILIGFLITLII